MAPPDQAPSDKQLPNPRHYPLDIDLPFEQYEHRRLVARDILVNRVMSKFLYPGCQGLAQAYDTHRSLDNGLYNLAPIKRHDKSLASDLELLRKMLATCSTTEDHFEPSHNTPQAKMLSPMGSLQVARLLRMAWPSGAGHEMMVRATIGEEIMDLVMRHYLETDDAGLRLWLHTVQPPSLSSYNTVPTGSRPVHTHAAAAQIRKRRDAAQIAAGRRKWYSEDTQRLAAIQAKIQESRLTPLCNGGAFLPQLRLRLYASRAARMDYRANTDIENDILFFYPESYRDRVMGMVYPWLDGEAPRRVFHVPSWGSRSKRQSQRALESLPPVEFSSGVSGRGPQRNGIWSTAVRSGGVVERGRSVSRSRRRATSEPPHGMFTSCRLPQSLSRLMETLIFPRMKLSSLDQRSRRRSLSRTRIAEMFDWQARPRQQCRQERRQPEAQGGGQRSTWQVPVTHEYLVRLLALNEIVEHRDLLFHMDVDKLEWARLGRIMHRILDEAEGRTSVEHPCPNCAASHLICPEPCGFCGAPSPDGSCIATTLSFLGLKTSDRTPGQESGQQDNLHIAPDCPVAKQNRCKCGPFPQFHVAAKCAVLCSRDCGNVHPPGHFKHRNAMTCKARCCMCGIRGHSGSRCKLKRCRCGGAHLGQDCTWKVECRVEGCYNFLCGVHCSECGISRHQLEEGSRFEGRRCPACLGRTGLAEDVATRSTESGEERADCMPTTNPTQGGGQRGRRRNPRKRRGTKPKGEGPEKDAPELPWYTPLQPRTRPIVVSKSGKRNTWKDAANKC